MLNFKKTDLLYLISFLSFAFCMPNYSQILSKQQTINFYNQLYKSTELTKMEWIGGNESKCICGTLAESIYKKAEDRINFFRLVNGLSTVKINPKFNKEAQEAAFMMDVNDKLSHHPSKKWKCYSEAGDKGAEKSCLGTSDFEYFHSTSFVTGFIEDIGDENYFVGHRRWLLYSKLETFGYGATDHAEAILTVDGIGNSVKEFPEFTAYPWNGYVPYQLIFPKWSFSISDSKTVYFGQAEITLTDANGKKIEVEVLEEKNDFLDHTIVWKPKNMFINKNDEKEDNDENEEYDEADQQIDKTKYLNKKITVSIKNVEIDGVKKDFIYTIEPIEIQ